MPPNSVQYRVSLSDHQVIPKLDKIERKTKKVDKAFKKASVSAKKTGLSFKSLGKNALNMAKGFGVMFGAMAAGRLISNSVKIFKEFEKSASGLQAILAEKGTVKNMKALTDQAKMLGAKTAFTASEILSLDTTLAKLGFDPQQIMNSVEGIQSLAAATGVDLATAADLAGSSLKIFGLDATEAGRVSDVLAKATTISALDMSKLAISLPIVGKAADIAGKSIEWTASRLGILASSGIPASKSGTAMNMIFTKLAQKGISYGDALEKISKSTKKTKTAVDLFGAQAANVGIILSENREEAADWQKQLEESTGTAKKMADVMLNNLAGDITIAGSAWEGFILSMEDGTGIINKAMRGIVQLGTAILQSFTEGNAITRALKGVTDVFGELFSEIGKVFALFTSGVGEISILDLAIKSLGYQLKIMLEPLRVIIKIIGLLWKGFRMVVEWVKKLYTKFAGFRKVIDTILEPIRELIRTYRKIRGFFEKDKEVGPQSGNGKKLKSRKGDREEEVREFARSGNSKKVAEMLGLSHKLVKTKTGIDLVRKLTGVESFGKTDITDKTLDDKTLDDKTKKSKELGINGITAAAPKTFIINIAEFIKEFSVNTTNITEGASEARRVMGEAMLEMTNDVSILAGQK